MAIPLVEWVGPSGLEPLPSALSGVPDDHAGPVVSHGGIQVDSADLALNFGADVGGSSRSV